MARLPRVTSPPAESSEFARDTLETMESAEQYITWLYERAWPYLGRRVLDVGAGTGSFTARLLDDERTVVAVEPASQLAQVLRARLGGDPRLTIVEGQASDVGDARAFDSAICFNVLEHIPDDAAALADFRRLLTRDGRLLLLVPAHRLLYGATDRALGHERRYGKEQLRALLERSGYRVELLRFVNPVGAFGWLVSARLLRQKKIPAAPLRFYDRFVPMLRVLDRVELPFGLSLWAVARAPSTP